MATTFKTLTANDIVNTINELIGIEEILIQNAETPAARVYEASIAEFKATQNELIKLAEKWGKKRSKAEVWSKEKIEAENVELSKTGEQYSVYNFKELAISSLFLLPLASNFIKFCLPELYVKLVRASI